MRRMQNIPTDRNKRVSEEKAPDKTPLTNAERAEERIFEEAKEKDEVISGVRTKIGGKK